MQTVKEMQTEDLMTMAAEMSGSEASGSGRPVTACPPVTARRLDPCRPSCWSGVPLRYSVHARSRCEEREIPKITYLPADSRLADVDLSDAQVEAVTFKVSSGDDSFFMVLGVDGCVLTVYRKNQAYKTAQRLKQRRRELLARAA